MQPPKRNWIEGQPVLVVIDIQGGAPALIEKARACNVPVVFLQEAHRRDLVDFGRELDGAEGIHLLEGDPGTEIAQAVGLRPDDYFIRKRRYSAAVMAAFDAFQARTTQAATG